VTFVRDDWLYQRCLRPETVGFMFATHEPAPLATFSVGNPTSSRIDGTATDLPARGTAGNLRQSC
jgi:hypothetical protein